MTHDATPDAARLRGWSPRRPADDTPDADEAADRIILLLDDLTRTRLGLSADLGVLASAVELRAFDVADEVVDGTRADLQALADRLAERADASGDPCPVVPLRRPRRRVLRAALPAAPALAAAAALVGVLAGLTPAPRPAEPTGPVQVDAAAASYAELYRLHERGVGGQALQDAARALHAEVARVMALAASDPAAAEAALRELLGAVTAVADEDLRADLRSVLAESQRLLAALEAAVSATGSSAERRLARLAAQPETRPQLDTELRPQPRRAPQPAAPAAPQPSASSASTPTPSATADDGAEQTPAPTSEPRPTSPPLFPGQGSVGTLPRSLPPS
jgi:hypothetical protein